MSAHRMLASYLHRSQIAAIVELECSQSSMLASPEVHELGQHLAMHVAAMAPQLLSLEDRNFNSGALIPDAFLDHSNALLTQDFFMAPNVSVASHISQVARALGGTITVLRFWRHVVSAP